MKFLNIKLSIFFLFIALMSGYSQQASNKFRFANTQILTGTTVDTFSFDVEMKVNQTGTFPTDGSIYFDYNTTAFGSNIRSNGNIQVEFLELLDEQFAGILDKYSIVNVTDNTPNIAAITWGQVLFSSTPNVGVLTEADTTFKGLIRVKIPIIDSSALAGINFESALMNGQTFYTTAIITPNTLPYNATTYTNNLLNEPLQSVSCPTIAITTTVTDETCYGNDGAIQATISGNGTPPYTITYGIANTIQVNFNTTTTISGLSAGNYTITAIDAVGCTDSVVVAVGMTSPPTTIIVPSTIAPILVGDNLTYAVANNPNSTYLWQVTNGTILTGQGTNQISANWSNIGMGSVIITESDTLTGCSTSDTLSQSVLNNVFNPNFTVTGGCGEMYLSWNYDSTVSMIYIDRHISGQGYVNLSTHLPSDTTYLDLTNIQADSIYCYYIYAELSPGIFSLPSPIQCDTALLAPPSLAPTITTITPQPNSILINWTNTSTTNIDGFILKNGSGQVLDTIWGANITSYNHTNLLPNTNYCYQITAFNTCGLSPNSVTHCDFTLPFCPSPSNLTATLQSSIQATITWDNNCPSATGQLLLRKNLTTNTQVPFNIGGTDSSYIDHTLIPNHCYEYKVQTLFGFGNSSLPSNMDTVCTDSICGYSLGNITPTCNDLCFSLPVTTHNPISNGLGWDGTLSFDSTNYDFMGISVNGNLINPNFTNYNTHTNPNGTINFTIFLKSNAGSTTFNGIGTFFTLDFCKKTTGYVPNDVVQISNFKESFAGGVVYYCVEDGTIIEQNNDIVTGTLKALTKTGKHLLPYDVNVPTHLPMTVTGATDANCNNLSLDPVTVDAQAKFEHDIMEGTFVKIERDIPNTTFIMSFINGFDALYTQQLALKQPTIGTNGNVVNLTMRHLIAADVNMDGVISAGDVSLINKRTVLIIGEFSPHNRDWIFLDSLTYHSFQASSYYPSGTLPNFSSCIEIPRQIGICTTYNDMTYYGILLGDVDSNYLFGNGSKSGNLRDSLVFYLNDANLTGNILKVPTYIINNSGRTINALDFSIHFDSTQVMYNSYAIPHVNLDGDAINAIGNRLLYTSYSNTTYSSTDVLQPFMDLYFTTSNSNVVIDSTFLHTFETYINGDSSNIKAVVMKDVTSRSAKINWQQQINIYPNPTNNQFTIDYKTLSIDIYSLTLYSTQGQLITQLPINSNGITSFNMRDLPNGVYFVQINNSLYKKVVKID